ncbi:uncharacterized protein LJ206_006986 [Theristicus caerulescens]
MLSIPCQEGTEVQREGKKVFKTSPPWYLPIENTSILLSKADGLQKFTRAMNIWLLLSALVYLRRCLSTSTREQGSSKTHIFYAVEIDGDSNTASFLAKQHGMQFISKVKWMNIRQLIIETSMLHSQSRMTEQVMILYRRKMRSLVKPTMSLNLKKDSETHWCLMTLIGLYKRNWYDLLKEAYGSLEILRNTVFFTGKNCSHAFLNTAWF